MTMGQGRSGGRGRGDKKSGDKQQGQRRPMFRRRKVCKFCADKIDDINYKDVKLLGAFVPERGKILPRRISGTCAMHQRKLQTAIKRARQIAGLVRGERSEIENFMAERKAHALAERERGAGVGVRSAEIGRGKHGVAREQIAVIIPIPALRIIDANTARHVERVRTQRSAALRERRNRDAAKIEVDEMARTVEHDAVRGRGFEGGRRIEHRRGRGPGRPNGARQHRNGGGS